MVVAARRRQHVPLRVYTIRPKFLPKEYYSDARIGLFCASGHPDAATFGWRAQPARGAAPPPQAGAANAIGIAKIIVDAIDVCDELTQARAVAVRDDHHTRAQDILLSL